MIDDIFVYNAIQFFGFNKHWYYILSTARTVEKTMTWSITWSDMATTTTTAVPTVPVNKAQVSPAVIGGSIGAVVLVIIIVLVVGCLCWKKKKGSCNFTLQLTYQ